MSIKLPPVGTKFTGGPCCNCVAILVAYPDGNEVCLDAEDVADLLSAYAKRLEGVGCWEEPPPLPEAGNDD